MEENNYNQGMYEDSSSTAVVAQAPAPKKIERHYNVPSREDLTSVIRENGKILRDHYLIGIDPEVAVKLKELKRDYVEFIKDSKGFSYFAVYGSESNENGKTITHSPNENLFKLVHGEHIVSGAGVRARLVHGSKLSLEKEVQKEALSA